jgi:hypothetical protein
VIAFIHNSYGKIAVAASATPDISQSRSAGNLARGLIVSKGTQEGFYMRKRSRELRGIFFLFPVFIMHRNRGFESMDLVKRIATIFTVTSAIICCLLLACLPVSYHLVLSDVDTDSRRVIAHDSIAITPHFRCGISGGGIWFFNLDYPYSGSTRHISDGQGGIFYRGGRAREKHDWGCRAGGYGISQVSFIGEQGELVGKDRFGDLPGIYYRHFEWWTLRLSLWYPILLFAVLPALWVVRNRSLLARKPMPKSATQ